MNHRFNCTVSIEDTDTYQIVFHPNYLVFFERARCDYFTPSKLKELEASGLRLVMKNIEILNYKKSAKHGDRLTVQTSIISASQEEIKFHHASVLLGGFDPLMEAVLTIICIDQQNKVVNIPTIFWDSTKPYPAYKKNIINPPITPPSSNNEDPNVYPCVAYQDRFGYDNHLTYKSIFCLFDQARTVLVGGPQRLSSLAKESNILVVTGKIQNVEFNLDHKVEVGEKLAVSTNVVHSEKSPISRFFQTLIIPSSNEILASASITCVSIDKDNGSPCPMPFLITNKGPI